MININCDLSHKHSAPERPVWSIQTLGFPEAITISIIRSTGKHKFVIPGLLESVTEFVLKFNMNFGQIKCYSGTLSARKIPLMSGYCYLLSATVITVIRPRYVNVSTQLIPYGHNIGCTVQNGIKKHDVLHTCTMILSQHFQAHRHLCIDRLWL